MANIEKTATHEQLVAQILKNVYIGLGLCVEPLAEIAKRRNENQEDALLQWVMNWIMTGVVEQPANEPTRQQVEDLARTLRETADHVLPILARLLG